MNSPEDDVNESSHLLSTYCIPGKCLEMCLVITKILPAVGMIISSLQINCLWIISGYQGRGSWRDRVDVGLVCSVKCGYQ